MSEHLNDLRKLIVEAASREPSADAIFSEAIDVENSPDLELSLEDHKQQYEIDSLNQQLLEQQDTHSARIKYVGRIFWLVVGWLACVVTCVMFAGFKFRDFQLSDHVIIAFITSTTINVLGLFVLVAKWLYPATNGIAKKVRMVKKSTKPS